jgi:hypothetical protein
MTRLFVIPAFEPDLFLHQGRVGEIALTVEFARVQRA